MPKYGMTPEQGVKLVSAFTMLHMWRHMHLRWTLRLLHLWRHLYRHLIRLHLLWHARTRARLHRLLGHRLWHRPTCLHFKKMIKIGIWTRNLSMLFLDLWTRHHQKLILTEKSTLTMTLNFTLWYQKQNNIDSICMQSMTVYNSDFCFWCKQEIFSTSLEAVYHTGRHWTS